MAKSIKLKNNKYWDSSSISHNRELLSTKVINSSGSNSYGNWIKFEDGTMICTRTITATIDCTNTWGTLYYGQNNDKYNFAQNFIKPPILNLQYSVTGAMSFIPIVYSGIVIDKDGFKRIEIARPNSVTNVGVKVYFIAIGKWK